MLISEIFSMSTKSPAAAAASAMLFLSGAVANLVFLSLHRWMGSASFLVFGAVAAAGAVYSYLNVPETMGKTLAEVQALLGTEVPAGDPTVTSLEALPRPVEVDQSASQQQVRQAHADSRLEAGLLLSSELHRSDAAEVSHRGHTYNTESGPGFLDRVRLQWTNWTGYRRYQNESDPADR